MKNKILTLVVAAAAMISIAAQALPITGGISMTGGYTPFPNTGDLQDATQFNLAPVGIVTSVSGSYAAAGITPFVTPVSWSSPLIVNPPTGLVPLWNIPAFGASFDLTSFYVYASSAASIELRGNGMLHLGTYEDTAATWIATFNTAANTFSFSASNGAVPDGGMTLILLGTAFTAMGLIRRKMA